jgi:hypothetical protein
MRFVGGTATPDETHVNIERMNGRLEQCNPRSSGSPTCGCIHADPVTDGRGHSNLTCARVRECP